MPDDVGLMHSMKFGATLLNPQLTRFRLWAPDAAEVSVLVKTPRHNEAQEIKMFPVKVVDGDPACAEGWFQKDIECGAGSRYVYKVTNKQGDQLTVADPASRAQVDSVHSDSIVVNPTSYVWRNQNWHGRPWHETVLYELHVGAFGGFNGVRERLAGLASIGITGIEMMPIASFPGPRNWGYDGVLQFAPQYTYGTPDELKALVDEAHSLGMTIFLDVVYNHFGPDGNFLYHYASPFFCQDIPTPWGDAINFNNPVVRQFYTENVLYWLQEYQFDGLRFDACHAIADKSWLFEIAEKVKQQFGPERYVHLMAENDDNTASLLDGGVALDDANSPGKFAAQWNDDGHHVLHSLLTGETEGYYSDYADSPAEKLARCLADGFIYQGDPSAHHNKPSRGEPSSHLPPTAFVLFLQNHDQIGNRPYGERLTTLVDPNALRAANALLLLSPQIPMLFMGEEFGATQPFMYFTSHDNEELVAAIREGRRREFASFSKFAKEGISVSIPEANDEDTFLMSIPRGDAEDDAKYLPLNWEQQTRHLLEIRHRDIIPRLAGASTIATRAIGHAAVTAQWKMADDMVLTIALNLGTEAINIDAADAARHQREDMLFQTGDTFEQFTTGILPGYSFIAFMGPAA